MVTHASNVSGVIQPIDAIAEIVNRHSALFAVDAAQTAGQVPIRLDELPIDFLTCAGHKSLLGPLGTGLLCIRPGLEAAVESVRQGGTGSASESEEQPEQLPDRLESGNLNTPGIFGLVAGLDFINSIGLDAIQDHKRRLDERMLERLVETNAIRIFGRSANQPATGVLSLNIDGFDPQDAVAILDQNFDIQARAGLQCAPGAHRALGTLGSGGTIRLSPGFFNTTDDVDRVADALIAIAASV